ncbi:hypothetical protein, partial [Stenotrophomonas sp. GbtcB23]|uniref:hypothetical protein n=1 Tax=Stenotrophomonas sp. GbtcB23 TaxID=2824768 RepID=UPI001C30B452
PLPLSAGPAGGLAAMLVGRPRRAKPAAAGGSPGTGLGGAAPPAAKGVIANARLTGVTLPPILVLPPAPHGAGVAGPW